MSELIVRVCDIFVSPVLRKIRQCSYRQLVVFTLAIWFCSLGNITYANEKLSRYEIVSALFERVFNKEITEMQAIDSGLLEPYDDGRYHLDWPVTRGMAAKMFYSMAVQSASAVTLPRAFADIRPGSEYKKALSVVGGAFLPQRGGKFNAQHILTRKDMYHAIKVLIDKDVFRQKDLSDEEEEVINEPYTVTNIGVNKKQFEPSGKKKNKSYKADTSINISPFVKDPDYDYVYTMSALKKLDKAQKRVGLKQINPQAMLNIENAIKAMNSVEKFMKSLTASTIDLIETQTKTKQDERAVKKALKNINIVLKGMIERFEYSKIQLKALIPVSPEQIRKCGKLNARLTRYIKDAKILQHKIYERMKLKR